MVQDRIAIKPHHFVDIITSFGAGERTFEPHPYGHAVHSVSQRLLDDRDLLLEIDLGADAICEPCIHNIAGSCDDTIPRSVGPLVPSSKIEYNLTIDERWCDRLGLKQGDLLSARELAQQIRERMGDITDIYREISAERTAERTQKLVKGLQFFVVS
jgi:hypothetical protein